MIISHANKLIFVKNPKTATTAINIAFRQSDIEIDHALENTIAGLDPIGKPWLVQYTLVDMVAHGFVTEEQLDSYKIYGVYRDPVDVFVSACNYIKNVNSELLPHPDASYEAIFASESVMDIIGNQTRYLGDPRITILDYNNINTVIPDLIRSYGGTCGDLQYVNHHEGEDISPELRAQVEEYYSADYELAARINI